MKSGDETTKPLTLEEKIDLIWDACFNHLPSLFAGCETRLKWQDVKMNFLLALLAIILAFLAVQVFV